MAVQVKVVLILSLLGAVACRETFHEWTKQVCSCLGDACSPTSAAIVSPTLIVCAVREGVLEQGRV